MSNPREAGVAETFPLCSRQFFWRCVVSNERGPGVSNDFASLQSCFVEGTAEQRARERRIRRRALLISVSAQAAILTVIILLPLFAKPERIALADMVPIPPYYHERAATHTETPQPPTHRHVTNLCATCYPPVIPTHIATRDDAEPKAPGIGIDVPGGSDTPTTPWGIGIDDGRRQPTAPDVRPHPPQRIVVAHLEPAMLIHRIEPAYPRLAQQIRRSGRVELRAIIATDGTIKSLQVVSGDALFIQSALDAVNQWRYRPTILNGQPVEIDTFITVTYNIQQ
jgi:periplasmic protein TonB